VLLHRQIKGEPKIRKEKGWKGRPLSEYIHTRMNVHKDIKGRRIERKGEEASSDIGG